MRIFMVHIVTVLPPEEDKDDKIYGDKKEEKPPWLLPPYPYPYFRLNASHTSASVQTNMVPTEGQPHILYGLRRNDKQGKQNDIGKHNQYNR
jgi:hypothetical protein